MYPFEKENSSFCMILSEKLIFHKIWQICTGVNKEQIKKIDEGEVMEEEQEE